MTSQSLKKIITFLSNYHKLPLAGWEFEVYRRYPELTKELAIRLFTKEGEKWIRGNPLPLDAKAFSSFISEYLEKLAKRYDIEFVELHVSTCMYEGDIGSSNSRQVELFFDFDPTSSDRVIAFSESMSQAKLAYKYILNERGLMIYSGNRSIHIVVRDYEVDLEFTQEYIEALVKALKNTYIRESSGRMQRTKKLALLDYQALSTKCHLRRMLYSPHHKSRLVSWPVKPNYTYNKTVEEMKAIIKRLLSSS